MENGPVLSVTQRNKNNNPKLRIDMSKSKLGRISNLNSSLLPPSLVFFLFLFSFPPSFLSFLSYFSFFFFLNLVLRFKPKYILDSSDISLKTFSISCATCSSYACKSKEDDSLITWHQTFLQISIFKKLCLPSRNGIFSLALSKEIKLFQDQKGNAAHKLWILGEFCFLKNSLLINTFF